MDPGLGHHSEASVTVERAVIFLLLKRLAFNLWDTQGAWSQSNEVCLCAERGPCRVFQGPGCHLRGQLPSNVTGDNT